MFFSLNGLWRCEGEGWVAEASPRACPTIIRQEKLCWEDEGGVGGRPGEVGGSGCMLSFGPLCRRPHHRLPDGVGGEITDLPGPADPTCGLCHHGPALGAGVPGAASLQPEAAGPSVPFCLCPRLVRRGVQVRARARYPLSLLLPPTSFLFPHLPIHVAFQK